MDRFFLGSLVADINRAIGLCLKHTLAEHLDFFLPLDSDVSGGERHLKLLRYLYAIDDQCPVKRLLLVKRNVGAICDRFNHGDVTILFHFGEAPPPPDLEGRLVVFLRFHLVDWQQSHDWNRGCVASLLDDPDKFGRELPAWLCLEKGIQRHLFEDEAMHYCQRFISSDFSRLDKVRDLEESFWRVVNLACAHFERDDYDGLMDLVQPRFRDKVLDVPESWQKLRERGHGFEMADFRDCCRNSVRLIQQLIDSAVVS